MVAASTQDIFDSSSHLRLRRVGLPPSYLKLQASITHWKGILRIQFGGIQIKISSSNKNIQCFIDLATPSVTSQVLQSVASNWAVKYTNSNAVIHTHIVVVVFTVGSMSDWSNMTSWLTVFKHRVVMCVNTGCVVGARLGMQINRRQTATVTTNAGFQSNNTV